MEDENNNRDGFESVALIPQLFGAVVVFLVGLFILIINLMTLSHDIFYIETTARIVDTSYDSNRNCHIPIYEYNFNGEKVTVDGVDCSSDSDDINIGEEITISYNPKNYHKFDIGSKKDSLMSWLFSILCLLISGSILYKFIKTVKGLIGLGYHIRDILRSNKNEEDTDDTTDNIN